MRARAQRVVAGTGRSHAEAAIVGDPMRNQITQRTLDWRSHSRSRTGPRATFRWPLDGRNLFKEHFKTAHKFVLERKSQDLVCL